MKPEYVIKVGNIFVHNHFFYGDTCGLTSKQHDATRYEDEGLAKTVKWLMLYEIPFTVYRVDGELRKFTKEETTKVIEKINA